MLETASASEKRRVIAGLTQLRKDVKMLHESGVYGTVVWVWVTYSAVVCAVRRAGEKEQRPGYGSYHDIVHRTLS